MSREGLEKIRFQNVSSRSEHVRYEWKQVVVGFCNVFESKQCNIYKAIQKNRLVRLWVLEVSTLPIL